ncbi:MAG: TrpB-like pyridoxal phosphate-dependent enzyme [Methanocorpusculum sp.]|jgi:tryptophan synthase beta chain|nr:TrpB-like pyridoxal phosphate-dependent enzyme [Methanocorpusculum sp.]
MFPKDGRTTLTVDDIPKKWYNIAVDIGSPEILNPGTMKPVTHEDLAPVFCKTSVEQELDTTHRFIDIPDVVREAYAQFGRVTPLQRAYHLEQYLKTPAKIYFKREDVSPTGSHKLNSAIAQAYYNKRDGTEHLTTETGAGQWGSALSLSCNYFDLDLIVFMVKVSFEQKPFRRSIMETYGSTVYPSPSPVTEYGKSVLAKDPSYGGTLGTAITEAVEMAVKDPTGKTKYSLGSVANHVCMHQTVIGQELIAQLNEIDVTPDHMIGCIGGGSNFAGFSFPMIQKKLHGKIDTNFLAVEPSEVPSLTKGEYRYDFGDSGCITPLFKMHTLGHDFTPNAVHAGGLRYHGMNPLVSRLYDNKTINAVSYNQEQVFQAAVTFARTEGIIPAPESAHAIRAAVDLALEAKKKNEEQTIVFNLSGHGLLDMAGYANHFKTCKQTVIEV